jgi:sporulation protein YpjB
MFFRKLYFGFLIMIIVCFLTSCAHLQKEVSVEAAPSAETSKQILRFSQMGDEVYNKTVNDDFLEARKEIIQMMEWIPQMRLDGVTSISGARTLTDTLEQAIKVFNAIQLDPEQALIASARIRLMADALSHPNTPLWLQYNKVIQEDLRVMEQALKQKKFEELNQMWIQLRTHYQVIQPAIQVTLQEGDITKLETAFQLVHIELQAVPMRNADATHSLKKLHQELDNLFQIKSETTAYLPFIEPNDPMLYWMFILAAIIIMVLGFVAWRMRVTRNDIITIKREI